MSYFSFFTFHLFYSSTWLLILTYSPGFVRSRGCTYVRLLFIALALKSQSLVFIPLAQGSRGVMFWNPSSVRRSDSQLTGVANLWFVGVLFQEFDDSFLELKEAPGVGDQYAQRRLRFELDLQDDVLAKASGILGRMKVLSTFTCWAGSVSQSDVWEGRIEELESIVATSGKKAAAAYAKNFYSGRSGLSSQHACDWAEQESASVLQSFEAESSLVFRVSLVFWFWREEAQG